MKMQELRSPAAKNFGRPSSTFLFSSLSLAHTHTHSHTHMYLPTPPTHTCTCTYTWFYARGCINMNQGWQWRVEWKPTASYFRRSPEAKWIRNTVGWLTSHTGSPTQTWKILHIQPQHNLLSVLLFFFFLKKIIKPQSVSLQSEKWQWYYRCN